MATMAQIDHAAQEFAAARAALVDVAVAFQNDLNAVKLKHTHDLKTHVASARAAHGALVDLLRESRELFAKPKSVTLHGVKVGYKKGAGKIEWEDADQVVRLIKKHFPDQAEVLVITQEKPAKEALAQLSAADLKKLGVTVEESGDVPFVKDTAAEVDKLVEAFLKDEAKDEDQREERKAA